MDAQVADNIMPESNERDNTETPHNAYGPYAVLKPLMRHFGASCSPQHFYWAVNEAYHAAEAAHYDTIHSDMYAEEERVWKHLLDMLPPIPARLKFLDVGCGTGLVGHFASQICPHRVGEMHLLDPSIAMIDVAREKAGKWPFRTSFYHGDILSLPAASLYDVVTINSVLHHVVELEPFLKRVQDLLRPEGLLLTAQDPRSGATADRILCERTASVAQSPQLPVSALRKIRHFVAPMIKNLLGIQRHGPLANATSRRLLDRRIIARPMDSESIWAVTDFHVPGHPGNFGKGIDIAACAAWMPGMKLVRIRTYHFHDTPWLRLTDTERHQESLWWAAGDLHGSLVASSFQKQT